MVIWAIASDELIDLVFTDCGHVQLLFVFFFSAWFPNKFNGRKLNSNPWSSHGYGDVWVLSDSAMFIVLLLISLWVLCALLLAHSSAASYKEGEEGENKEV